MADSPGVLILADDLIWADRLTGAVRAAGGTATSVPTLARFESGLADADAAIVDLTGRRYDGVEAVARASAAGCPVLAVGQHDDHALRKRALVAGADRVLAYRRLADDGPASVRAFLHRSALDVAPTAPAPG